MNQYSFWLKRCVYSDLAVGQQAIQCLSLGLIHENRTAQSAFPVLCFAGEDMASSRLSPDQLSRAGAGKPLFGSAMRFHFPFFHDR
jgi:hypothetical protein